MNRLALMLLFLAGITSLPAQQNGIEQDLELIAYPSGDKVIFWYGHVGRSYFLQVSDPTDHLKKWHWANIIEGGADAGISHQVEGTADKGFFRLKYTDQVPGTGEDLDTADFDNDGIANKDEVEPPEGVSQTDPLNPDTDGDGLPDGWEVDHNLDPSDATGPNGSDGDPDHDGLNNLDEYTNETDPNNSDSDDDGITDGGEVDQNTDPNDPEDTPDAEWFILTGDLDMDVVKTRSRTVTIPAGMSRVLAVVIASEEYPDWTDPEAPKDYNDVLTWDIHPTGGQPLTGNVDVNDRDSEWDDALLEGRTTHGFSPAYVENGMTLTAPDDAALTVEIELSATNIGDGGWFSTVMVAVLPVEPVEFFPVLQDGDGNNIDGSENPRTASGQTNGMVEEDPVTNHIAHREMRMRIVDGEILEGKKLTWTMTELFVRPTGGDPVFRGSWANSTTHPNRYETSAHFGANGFEAVDQTQVKTIIDENGESAIRANLSPVGFNKGRLLIAFEDFEGDPAKVADMEMPAVVVIDPGHGGTAPGNQSGVYNEKDLTLDYALSTRAQLRTWFSERQPFHRVIITRDSDTTVAFLARPSMARDNGADVFLSIHFNDGGATARGAETLIRGAANANYDADNNLAVRIQQAAVAAVGFTRTPGVKDYDTQSTANPPPLSNWIVLRDDDEAFNNTNAYSPIRGCIQEVDFMSNPTALDAITDTNNGPILRTNYAFSVSYVIITDINNQP